jgi:hypothetical protein
MPLTSQQEPASPVPPELASPTSAQPLAPRPDFGSRASLLDQGEKRLSSAQLPSAPFDPKDPKEATAGTAAPPPDQQPQTKQAATTQQPKKDAQGQKHQRNDNSSIIVRSTLFAFCRLGLHFCIGWKDLGLVCRWR